VCLSICRGQLFSLLCRKIRTQIDVLGRFLLGLKLRSARFVNYIETREEPVLEPGVKHAS
jgi:hypothetical protein